jgi:hypothetical protein
MLKKFFSTTLGVKGKFIITTTWRMVQSVDKKCKKPNFLFNHNRMYKNGYCIDKKFILCVNFDFGWWCRSTLYYMYVVYCIPKYL